MLPDVGIGFLILFGTGSVMSMTTASDVKKVLATDAAFSKQHLTTCSVCQLERVRNVKLSPQFRVKKDLNTLEMGNKRR